MPTGVGDEEDWLIFFDVRALIQQVCVLEQDQEFAEWESEFFARVDKDLPLRNKWTYFYGHVAASACILNHWQTAHMASSPLDIHYIVGSMIGSASIT